MAQILIVDDETLIREWLEMCIVDYGIKKSDIFQANNGEDAYTIVKELTPQIIFTDITMPKIDGLEFIRNVRGIDKNVHIIILTCHDNFEFARTAMKYNVSEYLLKNELNKEDIIHLLCKINRKIASKSNNKKIDNLDLIVRGQYLRSIVNSKEKTLVSPEELLNYNVYIENKAFISITFTYARQVINHLNLHKNEYIKNPILFVNNTSDVVLIANIIGEEDEFSHIINKLIYKIKEYCGANINVGYSKIYYSTQDLACAINESIAMRESLFFLPKNIEGFERKQSKDERKIKVNIINYKNEIISIFNISGKEAAVILAEKLLKYIIDEKLFEASFIKRIFVEIIETIFNQVDDENINIKMQSKKIMNSANVNELESCVKEFFVLIKGNENISECISKAKQYINNNYYKSISLPDLAKEAYLSEEYFSRLFKKEVGITFNKYLNNLRMSKAKKMVCSMKLNINEIAMMVGISSSAYFSSMFKKHYGISPSAMREEIVAKNKR
ncbi:hypothetical protein SH2C18_50940 [Clostridium sediminicola]|uniref:response regulator transcription factor n=1 Tax=Clostridium sediminicola TaxID=3114879 RepID=UPI0031F242E2